MYLMNIIILLAKAHHFSTVQAATYQESHLVKVDSRRTWASGEYSREHGGGGPRVEALGRHMARSLMTALLISPLSVSLPW